MTVVKGESNRYIVIHPGIKAFEARNPGALFVALSRARSAGGNGEDPDFAWNPHVLVNEDTLCQVVNTANMARRSSEIDRIRRISDKTESAFSHLNNTAAFLAAIENIQHFSDQEE